MPHLPRPEQQGHLAAWLTILVWGMTFISTKVLLEDLHPAAILFLRFALGLAALWIVRPRRLRGTTPKQELTFLAAGLCGVCLYYLLENIALLWTMAGNVGVLTSTAPFFTALLAWAFRQEGGRLRLNFCVGFVVAMLGISLISLNGQALHCRPQGDLLALAAALVWGCYTLLIRRIGDYGYATILTTRRVFAYGLLCMTPVLPLTDCAFAPAVLLKPRCLLNLLFLGLCASALCFVSWNFAVRMLGSVRTSLYIYLIPVVTVAGSALILHEPLTWTSGCGMALTLLGLYISEGAAKA